MKRILLIVSGGIAAYKSLELVRLLKKDGFAVRCILTRGGQEFVTPLSLSTLSEDKVYSDLWSLTDEAEMGHIELSRSADLVVVAPASADLLAKMATGQADDLATTTLLATDKPVLVAPAMNVRMWDHAATKANLATLAARGIEFIGPNEGPMACNEYGFGRMAEPEEILIAIKAKLANSGALTGRTALVTSGPTHEAIDPVRFLGNRSSGKQGHAIAVALTRLGATVTLVSGPVALPDPAGVKTVHVISSGEMLAACRAALPADIVVAAAAVADWRIETPAKGKLKKGYASPDLNLVETSDILAELAQSRPRPSLVVGFAAETDNLAVEAAAKRERKRIDWIVANHVNAEGEVFGSDNNQVMFITAEGSETWPMQSKQAVADRLAAKITDHFKERT